MRPRLFALTHWPLPALLVSWISAGSPVLLSSNPFLHSMSNDNPESTTNFRSSGDFEIVAGVALISIGELNLALYVRVFFSATQPKSRSCHGVVGSASLKERRGRD